MITAVAELKMVYIFHHLLQSVTSVSRYVHKNGFYLPGPACWNHKSRTGPASRIESEHGQQVGHEPTEICNRLPGTADRVQPGAAMKDYFRRGEYAVGTVRGIPACDDGMTDVYAICAEEGPIKVGITNNLMRRLSELQTGNPNRLGIFVAYTVQTRHAADIERIIHQQLAADRVAGEWFNVEMERLRAMMIELVSRSWELTCEDLQSEIAKRDRRIADLESLLKIAVDT